MAELARRQVLTGLAGLPLAAILADTRRARAAAAGLTPVSLQISGGRQVSAALAVPESTPAPAVVLIHEWWGLNDRIKTV
ncbi:MAG: dienelactone hydrolase family protein, partial [Alphaproteobacteria bacterium]